jgi:hypothetical protein
VPFCLSWKVARLILLGFQVHPLVLFIISQANEHNVSYVSLTFKHTCIGLTHLRSSAVASHLQCHKSQGRLVSALRRVRFVNENTCYLPKSENTYFGAVGDAELAQLVIILLSNNKHSNNKGSIKSSNIKSDSAVPP